MKMFALTVFVVTPLVVSVIISVGAFTCHNKQHLDEYRKKICLMPMQIRNTVWL